jgi:hypothetical protein
MNAVIEEPQRINPWSGGSRICGESQVWKRTLASLCYSPFYFPPDGVGFLVTCPPRRKDHRTEERGDKELKK